MSRTRMLKPSFFTDERVVSVSAFARLLWMGLWCEADREGLLEDRPIAFKMRLFPVDSVDVSALLVELERAELIERYRVGGVALISIPRFLKHQHIHPRETRSKLPKPSGKACLEALASPSSQEKACLEPHASASSPVKACLEGVCKGVETGASTSASASASASKDLSMPAPADAVASSSDSLLIDFGQDQPSAVRRTGLALVDSGFDPLPAPRVKDPKLKEAQTALEAVFEQATGSKYKHGAAKDTQALKRILAHEPNVEAIAQRFAAALSNKGWPTVKTFAQLDQRWNDIPVSQAQGSPKITDRRSCDACGQPPAPFDVWGHRVCLCCHDEVTELLTGDKPSEVLAMTARNWIATRKRANTA